MADFLAMLQDVLDKAGNTHSVEDVIEGVGRGDYQWWGGENSFCVTEIIDYPQRKGFCFWLAAGDVNELMDKLEPEACSFAKEAGCDLAFGNLIDRKGWDRAVPDGYEKGWRVFRKNL